MAGLLKATSPVAKVAARAAVEVAASSANPTGVGRNSWRDIVDGGACLERFSAQPEVFQGNVKVVPAQGEVLLPCVSFDAPVMDSLAIGWSHAVVFRPLGGSLSYDYLGWKIKSILCIRGKYRLTDLSCNYFALRFELREDCERVLSEGPWSAGGLYLAVRRWSSSFNPLVDEFLSSPVWVRIHDLPLIFYEEKALSFISSALGEPVRVDPRTLWADRGKFARVSVSMDLNNPLPEFISVNGGKFRLEFENMQEVCHGCGVFGHYRRSCPLFLCHKPGVVVGVVGGGVENTASASPSAPGLGSHSDGGWKAPRRTRRRKKWMPTSCNRTGASGDSGPPAAPLPPAVVLPPPPVSSGSPPLLSTLPQESGSEGTSLVSHFEPAAVVGHGVLSVVESCSADSGSLLEANRFGVLSHLEEEESVALTLPNHNLNTEVLLGPTVVNLEEGECGGSLGFGPLALIPPLGPLSPLRFKADPSSSSNSAGRSTGIKRGFFGPITRAKAQSLAIPLGPDVSKAILKPGSGLPPPFS